MRLPAVLTTHKVKSLHVPYLINVTVSCSGERNYSLSNISVPP